MSTVWRGDELTIGQQKVNILVEHKMNMVFNPMSTTIVCSITLLYLSRCSIYPPLPASRRLLKECVGLLDSAFCVCVCMSERTYDQKLYGLCRARAIPRFFSKELKLAEAVENVTALLVS